ncbi:MAG: hypothetical protein KDB79_02790 [Acidobacteria bacterium]|nr:hypothetical protein [Acidobacteriota bacterium]
MKIRKLESFKNDGFGWECKKCSGADPELPLTDREGHSRLLFEGEAESKHPRFSNTAMAKWRDPEKQILICPICGISERVSD